MSNFKFYKFLLYLKAHKKAVICASCLLVILIFIIASPKTVESRNGFSHQVGSFGDCDVKLHGCTGNATHRRHYLFDNEDYCESCWVNYGQRMFEVLSETEPSYSTIEYDEYRCRHTGCNERAVSSDWKHRFCSEHIKGTKYCRYPNCTEQIPISGTSDYCWKH